MEWQIASESVNISTHFSHNSVQFIAISTPKSIRSVIIMTVKGVFWRITSSKGKNVKAIFPLILDWMPKREKLTLMLSKHEQ